MELLKLVNVTFSYANSVILKNVNIVISKSEFILLEGPSGIGKTTFCKLISGYQQPQSGNIYLRSEKLLKPSRSILYIPQEDDLFEWHTLKQHFEFISKLKNTNAPNAYLLDILGLSNVLHQSPKQLSGGQKKKAQIYKSFLINPMLIVFDETFSAIDQSSTDLIISEFMKIWKQKETSVIFVSHYSQNIKPYVGRVLKMEKLSLRAEN